MDFDVLFIGSGQGAYNGAIPMSQAGLKVAVAEEGRFGGVCTNRGCNAKITLDRPVEILRQVEQLQEKGFNGAPILNWEDLMAHKHEVIDGLSESNRMKLVNAGVTILTGHAKFVDDHTVSIDGHHYSSTKIVIVSGQHPHQMEIPGSELFHDSTDFLVTEHLPAKMAIIGGGYVAMESATIANAFGCDVTVILRGGTKVLRGGFYQPYVQKIISDLQSRGVKFNFSESIEQARQTTAGIQLNGTDGYQLTADYVLDASGRRPNVQNMDLDRIGLKFDEATGIEVDDHLQTNVPGIYATGGCNSKNGP
ncbi:FAD-dependent oxidoreductase [Lentilactobacillus senioris]|uniref:FAD-dependent oxidoreductase n=1 Tax=Lentilactobacillus senioris TaxID=931534 RepID=UPI000A4C4238|nr:NAD(P)/FAD-dependent oxidoreductase [Lentilactobacillus senioris]